VGAHALRARRRRPGARRPAPRCDPFPPPRILTTVTPTSAFAIDVPAALLDRARRGEAAAYEQLYRWFERPVFTLALRLTGQREEAQDVLQETMLKLFDRLQDFRGTSPFWGWLRQIAVNEALMRLRKRGRMGAEAEFEEADLEAHETLLPPRAADAALLARALAELPDATRSVLWLYHAEGYTHEEIAGLTGRTISFSKSQLARGTRRLRADLQIESGAIAHG
jgi:RNA polymerase sigma factor (sigma-70 family)